MEIDEHIEQLNRAIIRALRRLASIKDERKKQDEILKLDLYSWAMEEYLKKAKVICYDSVRSD